MVWSVPSPALRLQHWERGMSADVWVGMKPNPTLKVNETVVWYFASVSLGVWNMKVNEKNGLFQPFLMSFVCINK